MSYIMMLGCENDNLIELGEIGDEIVNTWTFGCAPAMLTLQEVFSLIERGKTHEKWCRFRNDDQEIPLTSQVLVTNKSSIDSNKV
jgi:hypothetical protein